MKSWRIPNFPAAILAVATVLTLGSGSASAGLFDDEEARKAILDLRQRLDTMRTESDQKLAEEVRKLSEEASQLRRSLVDLLNQLELAKAELAKLRGQDEQVSRDLAELQRKHKDSSQTFEERLRKFEPTRVTHDGKEFTVEATERRDYEAAMAVFRKGEFANVQVVFVDFLNRYVTSGYRPSALFWLGNAQYATKDYKEALANFRALIVLAPDHMRVPEAMLAIANCQLELKDNRGARKTLEDLLVSFPTSEAAAAAKDRLARFK